MKVRVLPRQQMIYREKPNDFNQKFEIVSCFFERDGKFLLLLRNDSKPQGNTWGVPAGKVEQGESLDQAICRELEEETGYKILSGLPKSTHTLFVRYPEYDFFYHMYQFSLDQDYSVQIDQRAHKEFRWVSPEEALKMNLIMDLDSCVELFYNIQDTSVRGVSV